jgi:REP element-mobilizing transposase RayT
MANTFSQINIHCVFAVQGRENLILTSFREDLHQYMYGILKNDGVYPLAIGGWKDHVHIFFELPPDLKISDLIRMLKSTTSKWINDNHLLKSKFNWQSGYGAFSYSRSQRNNVIQYIMNQEAHHQQKSFKEEYLDMLIKNEIKFEDKYIFEFYE